MRIVSLLPSMTEMVYALGLGDSLVGVSHECDYPPEAAAKPVVTSSCIELHDGTAAEIDAAVSALLRDGQGLYRLDSALIGALHPDVILTQELCALCAPTAGAARALGAALQPEPQVLGFAPASLAEVLSGLRQIGQLLGRADEAQALVAHLEQRVVRVCAQAQAISERPRVALLEWLDPPFGPGHWLPEMITSVGGVAGFGRPGEPARRISWGDVIAFAPEVIVVACCGMPLAAALVEARALLPRRTGWEALPAVRRGRVSVVDASAYCSRPGPRLVDSLELLAELVHPTHFAGWAPRHSFVQFEVA